MIVGGLLLGILCGVLFGEYCAGLQIVGQAYVGLLQMTVLPYLTISLIAKMGRLDAEQARKLGLTALVVLLILWLIGIALIVLVSGILPPMQGASFYSPQPEPAGGDWQDVFSRFIPTNIFRSLADDYVPAVVVFCLFFGCALMMVPGKEPVLDFLDLCSTSLGQINQFLVRLAPLGLFALTAAAAGTLPLEELSRLQAYLIMFLLACLVAAVGVLPVLVSSLTPIRYGAFIRAALEPALIAIATGKLFVVLPQITDKCDLRHTLFESDGPNADQNTFSFERLRLSIGGHVLSPDLQYFFQIDGGSDRSTEAIFLDDFATYDQFASGPVAGRCGLAVPHPGAVGVLAWRLAGPQGS